MPERAPFPAWLRELCYFGGLIVAITVFAITLKSDQQANSLRLDAMAQQLASIEARLPNREVDALRYKQLEDTVKQNKADEDFAIAKLEKWKDDTTRYLIKKGVID
jgi:hypothetical protein